MAIGADAKSTFLAIVKGDASQAVTEFKKLGNTVEKSTKGAEGSVGKFKQATNGAFAEIKANAGLMAAGAGVAIGAFVGKAVADFAALGIQVGKFSDATGMAAEDASRWIEVAGDIGVEASSMEKALGRLNRTIEPELFAELGIEIAKTADGATDVNKTFLNVIDRLNGMKNPTEKATVAQKLLGRGWQDMAELIGKGSGELSKSLAEVSDAKVVDANEVKKARQYREAMDELNDAFQDIVLTVGERLIPVVVTLAETLKPVASSLGWVADKAAELKEATADDDGNSFFGNLGDQAKWFFTNIKEGRAPWEAFGETTEKVNEELVKANTNVNKGRGALNGWSPAAKLAQEHADELAESTRKLDEATRDYTTTYDELLGKLDEEEAWENVIAKVFGAADGIDDTKQEARDAKRELAEYIDKFAKIPASVKTSLIAKLDQGAVNEVTAYLNGLRIGVTVPVKPVGSGLSTLGGGGPRANGGPISAGTPYLVGERGPELIVPSTSGMVLDATRTSNAMGSKGGTSYITINTAADPKSVVEAIKRYTRGGGVL